MRWWTKIAYAAPSVGLAGLSLPLLVYLPSYYATSAGLPLATVGTAFLVVRLLDILFDPIAGAAMDRTHGRFGRFRPWLAGATPVLMLFVWLLFNPPAGSGAGRMITSLAGLYAAWSICFIAQLGWGCVLAPDYRGRNAIFAWWQGLYLLGSLIVTAIPILPIFRATAVPAMGWFVILAAPIGVALALALVPEPASPPPRRPGLRACLSLLTRPAIARLLAIDLLLGIAVMLGGSLFFFYMATHHTIPRDKAAALFFLLNVGSFVGVWFWGWLGSRWAKHRAAAVAFVAYAAFLILIQIAPMASPPIGMAVILLFGSTLSAGPVLVRSMLGDVGDAEQLASGIDHKGLIAAFFSNSNKLGLALGPAIGFIGLGLAGFDPTAMAQTEAAATALSMLAICLPAILGLICAWLVSHHRLSATDHAAIVAQLNALPQS